MFDIPRIMQTLEQMAKPGSVDRAIITCASHLGDYDAEVKLLRLLTHHASKNWYWGKAMTDKVIKPTTEG